MFSQLGVGNVINDLPLADLVVWSVEGPVEAVDLGSINAQRMSPGLMDQPHVSVYKKRQG